MRVPLNVGETSDGAHMNTGDFIASGCASYVRTSTELRGGFTGAMRTAHLADAYRLRAEPHGPTMYARHLCMAIPNCTYYESLVTTNPAQREAGVSEVGHGCGPGGPGRWPRAGPHLSRRVASLRVRCGDRCGGVVMSAGGRGDASSCDVFNQVANSE